MADESQNSKAVTKIFETLISFVPQELREMLGIFTGLVLMFAVPACVVFGTMTAYNLMQATKGKDISCWQIQAVEQRTFKLNTCTGEMVEVPVSASMAPVATPK